ncbi:eukaryotic translation initiation factor 2-alpha kinase 3 [Caerostris darwini]|uniref:Eukaryotic translation initiation factor 2-alpha kinase 3 n=1 Tax=Caerostris darwini TaxID=1538125 RepID=A0AAV4RJE8_9ARAC|nr:eukaryotic translation initiation factor 2-alpha kinase 3 [Caerostris darwini]
MHCSLTYCAENKFEWPFCETRETESDCGKDGYVFIATMDGNITALDFNFGFKCWSIVLDPKGFLSSTLSKLKVWENGTQVWIVPSLDGHMFKYDKMKLEPFSFNSEHLVNHAFIIDSSSSITGGKFKVIYGLNRHTGQLEQLDSKNQCPINSSVGKGGKKGGKEQEIAERTQNPVGAFYWLGKSGRKR